MTYRSACLSLLIAVLAVVVLVAPAEAAKDPEALIAGVVDAVGGAGALHARQDVEYTYLYRRPDGKLDVSLERYVFDGELSWASYPVHEGFIEDSPLEITQGYDGESSWIALGGDRLGAPQASKMADFLRKTNYYWFSMMFKLLDPGCLYSYEGTREHDGTTYDLVKLTFKSGVGDVSDTYLLYIHPETHLIDRFLFTVLDFGLENPLLMEVRYEEIDGLQLPTYRRYAPAAGWDGALAADATWTEEISVGVRFGNGFDRSLFAAPPVGERNH